MNQCKRLKHSKQCLFKTVVMNNGNCCIDFLIWTLIRICHSILKELQMVRINCKIEKNRIMNFDNSLSLSLPEPRNYTFIQLICYFSNDRKCDSLEIACEVAL